MNKIKKKELMSQLRYLKMHVNAIHSASKALAETSAHTREAIYELVNWANPEEDIDKK